MSISVLNTDAGLSGKTLVNAEDAQTVTGAKTFDLDPNPPFVVSAGSAVVPNLDADKLDGLEATAFIREASAGTKSTGDLTFNDNINATFGTGGDADIRYDGTDLVVDTQVVGTGALSLTKGQIKFPASQNASTNANTLDDYEEGTWTPVITGTGGQSGQVYATQVGHYVKIGKLVHIQCRVILSTLGTITGSVQIGGLPFTSDATASNYAALSCSYFQSLTTAVIWVGAHVEPGGTVATLTRTSSAVTTAAAFAQADLAATSGFIIAGSYVASA